MEGCENRSGCPYVQAANAERDKAVNHARALASDLETTKESLRLEQHGRESLFRREVEHVIEIEYPELIPELKEAKSWYPPNN